MKLRTHISAIALILACAAGSAGAQLSPAQLPEEAQTYLRLRYSLDAGQYAAAVQLANAYWGIASAPHITWASNANQMEAAVNLMRAEKCMATRFTKVQRLQTVFHNMQRALFTEQEHLDGWNAFVESYKGKMPPAVGGEPCF